MWLGQARSPRSELHVAWASPLTAALDLHVGGTSPVTAASQHVCVWGYNARHARYTCKELVMWLGLEGMGVRKNAASMHCEQASKQGDTRDKRQSDARASESKQQQQARKTKNRGRGCTVAQCW